MPISDLTATASASAFDAAVSARLVDVRGRIAESVVIGGHGQTVTVIAVTKTHGPEAVVAAWRAGVHDVGENRVQEAEGKMAQVVEPVRWHLIGHLQRRKAKAALQFSLVHSVDSDRLADAIQRAALLANTVQDVLVQVNVSGESTKSGFALAQVPAFAERLHRYPNVRVMGAMTMAPYEAPESVLRDVFQGAFNARTTLQQAGHPAPWLSMGMSGDFEIAVQEGATHIRLGTILFGDRT